MKKLLLLLTLILLFSQLFSSNTFANSNIKTIKAITYSISQSGDIDTKYVLNLRNNSKEKLVITSYRFAIPFKEYTNGSVMINNQRYLYNSTKNNQGTDISIVLNSIVINSNDSINIEFSFKLPKYIDVTKNIKNITLPAKTSDIEQVDIKIIYPEYWILPLKISSAYIHENNNNQYIIRIPNIKDNFIEISLGNSLIYEYRVNKKFTNNEDISNIYTLNIPISINNQYVYFEKIEPIPDNIDIDDSNNITLQYILPPQTNLNAHIIAYIEYSQNIRNYNIKSIKYTKQTGYWSLNNETEKSRIYRYLKANNINQTSVENLSGDNLNRFYELVYNYIIDRLEPQQNNLLQNYTERRGIENILLDRGNSSLDDYIDFTVSIYRLLNIPTRVSIGYIAKTYNKSGYYHTWVEYYNENTNSWKKIDPYTEDLSKKSLYNQNLDDRITIITKDINPIAPQIQYLNTDEISVSQYDGTVTSFGQLEITVDKLEVSNTQKYNSFNISLKNKTNRILIIDDISLLDKDIRLPNSNIISQIILTPHQEKDIQYMVELRNIIDKNDLQINIDYKDNNNQKNSIITDIDIKKHYSVIELSIISIIISGLISGILYLIINRKKK